MNPLPYCSVDWILQDSHLICTGVLTSVASSFDAVDPVILGEYFAGGFCLVGVFAFLGMGVRLVLRVMS